MFTQVAVVPLDDEVGLTPEDLLPIAAALQVHVQRDLGPAWGVQAAVSAFTSLEAVPQGTWPVAVTNRADLPVDGFHFVMSGLPFGIVGNTDDLSVVLSHEISEMLVDPFGQLTITGPALTDNGAVDYLVEVCDACEGKTYYINGVAVADFVLPGYYHDDPKNVRARGYSFTGAVSAPRQVLQGGYISWRTQFPSNTVYQAFALPGGQIPNDVRQLTAASGLHSVPNPVGSQVQNTEGAENLAVLQLPNSPTRAWRELIAQVARELDPPDGDGSESQGSPADDKQASAETQEVPAEIQDPPAETQGPPADTQDPPADTQDPPAETQDPTPGEVFASTFRANIKALLPVITSKQPPPSVSEILAALERPAGKKTAGQTRLTNTQLTVYPDRNTRIIAYLRQQESLAGIFGPDLDSELGMWMFMIMP
jgi:hypothetical protein